MGKRKGERRIQTGAWERRPPKKSLKLILSLGFGAPAVRFTERSEWKFCVYTESSHIYCIHISVVGARCVFTSQASEQSGSRRCLFHVQTSWLLFVCLLESSLKQCCIRVPPAGAVNNRWCSPRPGLHTTTINSFALSYGCLLKALAFAMCVVRAGVLVKCTTGGHVVWKRAGFFSLFWFFFPRLFECCTM